VQILIGLGGNLGDVAAAFAVAAADLARTYRIVGRSHLWRTAPFGPPQPQYINAALLIEAGSDPLRLLACAQRLETAAGRNRARETPLGPRPLDVDLLLAPGLVIESPALVLPHPRLAERRFALLPAAELVPRWVHPRLHRSVADLAARLDPASQWCERLGSWPQDGHRHSATYAGGRIRRGTP
jgi:2-amino-4-hydroxy-6-hydroxymethyldihydropteridine diphosphokinase